MPTKLHFIDAFKIALAFALVFVMLQLVIMLTDVLLIFFTALILAIAMDKPISRLERRGVPRLVSALVLYIAVFASITLMLSALIPPLVGEARIFLTEYSTYSSAIPALDEVERFDIMPYLHSLSDSLTASSGAVMSVMFKTVGSFTTFLAIFFVALFLTLQKGGLRTLMDPFIPTAYKDEVSSFFTHMQDRVGSWLWGKTLSSLIIGFIIYIGLLLFGIPYAVTLAVLAVFLNYVPFVGPIIAAVPSILLGFATAGFTTALVVALFYFLINGVIESFLLAPLLMKRAVEINSAFLILSVMSGAYLGGILGIIIAIPVASIAFLAFTEYRQHQSRVQKKEV